VDEEGVRAFVVQMYGDEAPENLDRNIQKAAGGEDEV